MRWERIGRLGHAGVYVARPEIPVLNARKEQGARVDAKDVRKHLNDVLRLSQLLAPATRIPLAEKIGDDMARFLTAMASDNSIDRQALQLGNLTRAELVARIPLAYRIDLSGRARA